MYQCPNCGGHVVFDPALQKMKCEFCDSLFDPEPGDIPEQSEETSKPQVSVKEANDKYEANVFTCPQCGGEIISDENTAVTFCSYCGGSTVLEGRLAKIRKPDYVIPFSMTKEQAEEAYHKALNKSLFAPASMKQDSVVERFRGIYMPYWIYDFKTEGRTLVHGQKDHRRGDYIYHDHYEIESDLEADYDGISFDASSSFADSLSSAIAPYDISARENFDKGYLAGFYADTSDITQSVYKREARNIVKRDAANRLVKSQEYRKYNASFSDAMRNVGPDTESSTMGYFPVWFLSNRTGDRVSYAVVNGQTGRVAMDIPISFGKYLLGALVVAFPIFMLFNGVFTITPTVVVILAMLLGLIAAIVNGVQKHTLYVRENYLDDAGMRARQSSEARKAKREAAKAAKEAGEEVEEPEIESEEAESTKELDTDPLKTFGFIVFAIVITSLLNVIGVIIVFLVYKYVMSNNAVVPSKVAVKSKPVEKVPAGAVCSAIWKPLVGILVGIITLIIHPVSDLYYYGATLVVLAFMLWSFYDMVHLHNQLSSRPLPQFNRRGGDE